MGPLMGLFPLYNGFFLMITLANGKKILVTVLGFAHVPSGTRWTNNVVVFETKFFGLPVH